jgi:hypothetical protein
MPIVFARMCQLAFDRAEPLDLLGPRESSQAISHAQLAEHAQKTTFLPAASNE